MGMTALKVMIPTDEDDIRLQLYVVLSFEYNSLCYAKNQM
jgi:hypothetical protein